MQCGTFEKSQGTIKEHSYLLGRISELTEFQGVAVKHDYIHRHVSWLCVSILGLRRKKCSV